MGSSALITRNTDLKVAMPDLPPHRVHGDGYRQTKAERAPANRPYFPAFSRLRRLAKSSREDCASFLHAPASIKASGLPPLSRAASRPSRLEKPGCGVSKMSHGSVSRVAKLFSKPATRSG